VSVSALSPGTRLKKEKMAAAMGLLYFEQHTFRFENSLVILDIDGTIVPDCGRVASAAVLEKVRELKAQGNEVRLCSNSRRGNYAQRLDAIAAQLDVGVCPVVFRKPSALAISGIDRKGRALVVIGDKDLTDGLLARRVGAQFIKVRRKLDPADRLSSRMANLIDAVFGRAAIFLWDALNALSRRDR
jgi:predicted HAD superfamily phosphohydrolase YqeG